MHFQKNILIMATPLLCLLLIFQVAFAGSSGASEGSDQSLSDNSAGYNPEGISSVLTGESINWHVISQGSTNGSSSSFTIMGTLGQGIVGHGNSPNFDLSHGFWQSLGNQPTFLCGDANNDGGINVSDAVWIINYVFIGGPAPNPLASGDPNCDGSVNVSDAVYIINYVFVGGFGPCDVNGDSIPDC